MYLAIDFNEIIKATNETVYMSFVSTFFVAIFGLLIGTILFVTNKNSLMENKLIFTILNSIVNIFRAVPFIILIMILLPFSKVFTGSIIGVNAFIPSLVIAASPLYGRMVENAFKEVDKGLIEAGYAMGAKASTIVSKILFKEALPTIISSLTIVCISIVGYSAMAGIVGGGGLGEIARRYGFIKDDYTVVFIVTIIALCIVLIIQFIGDYISKKLDKREVN